MSERRPLVALTAAVLLACPVAAKSQPGAPAPVVLAARNTELAGKFEIDTAIPQTAGFSVIGLSPTSVVDPGATRVSLFSFASYLDENNNLKPGFALGGSPYWWFNSTTLDQYRAADRFTHLLARTEVSLGFADGGADDPDRLGFGFVTELLGNADYRLDTAFYDCTSRALDIVTAPVVSLRQVTLEEAIAQATREWEAWINRPDKTVRLPQVSDEALQIPTPGDKADWVPVRANDLIAAKTTVQITESKKASQADFEVERKKCRDQNTARFAKRRSLQIAGGVAAKMVDGQPSKTRVDGGSVWVSYRHPFTFAGVGAPNYFAVFGRYDFDKKETLPAGGSQDFDKAILALILGYEAGGSKISAQAGWESINYRSRGPNRDDDYLFYTLSYDYRLSDGVWLALKAGSKGDRKSIVDKKDDYLLANIRWQPSPN